MGISVSDFSISSLRRAWFILGVFVRQVSYFVFCISSSALLSTFVMLVSERSLIVLYFCLVILLLMVLILRNVGRWSDRDVINTPESKIRFGLPFI